MLREFLLDGMANQRAPFTIKFIHIRAIVAVIFPISRNQNRNVFGFL